MADLGSSKVIGDLEVVGNLILSNEAKGILSNVIDISFANTPDTAIFGYSDTDKTLKLTTSPAPQTNKSLTVNNGYPTTTYRANQTAYRFNARKNLSKLDFYIWGNSVVAPYGVISIYRSSDKVLMGRGTGNTGQFFYVPCNLSAGVEYTIILHHTLSDTGGAGSRFQPITSSTSNPGTTTNLDSAYGLISANNYSGSFVNDAGAYVTTASWSYSGSYDMIYFIAYEAISTGTTDLYFTKPTTNNGYNKFKFSKSGTNGTISVSLLVDHGAGYVVHQSGLVAGTEYDVSSIPVTSKIGVRVTITKSDIFAESITMYDWQLSHFEGLNAENIVFGVATSGPVNVGFRPKFVAVWSSAYPRAWYLWDGDTYGLQHASGSSGMSRVTDAYINGSGFVVPVSTYEIRYIALK